MQAKIIGIGLLLIATTTLYSQETARERIEQRKKNEIQQETHSLNGRPGAVHSQSVENARWSRVIYRYLDLSLEANASLYYPASPTNGQANLFTVLFRLLQEGSIPAYEYLDGQEVFTEEYLVEFGDLLDRFDIYHEKVDQALIINDADIPGNEVLGYFIKEVYYFDTPTSSLQVRPLALCPVLHRNENYDTRSTRYPLFWVPYQAIESHLRKIPLMGSSLNNSMGGSVDDFFRLRKYTGEIYKAQNPRNLAISQYTTTQEEMRAEQERIERELLEFEQHIKDQQIPGTAATPRTARSTRRGTVTAPANTSSVTMRDRRY